MLLDKFGGCVDPTPGQSVVLRQLLPRIQPELCFAAGVLDVHVRPWLFAGEEVEAIAAKSQNGRTHDPCISELPISSPGGRWDSILGQPPREGFCGRVGVGEQERGSRATETITSWRTPVVDPGQRAGPKVPDEERKASNRGCLGIGGRSTLCPEIVKLF